MEDRSALGDPNRSNTIIIGICFIFQELSILQDVGDTRGECKAHGNLGNVHLSLGQVNYRN